VRGTDRGPPEQNQGSDACSETSKDADPERLNGIGKAGGDETGGDETGGGADDGARDPERDL
jgi:general stress protein YciG